RTRFAAVGRSEGVIKSDKGLSSRLEHPDVRLSRPRKTRSGEAAFLRRQKAPPERSVSRRRNPRKRFTGHRQQRNVVHPRLARWGERKRHVLAASAKTLF